MDELSPQWILRQNKDGLAKINEALPKIREAQQATIDTANNGVRDAVIKAGNDYADKVTPGRKPVSSFPTRSTSGKFLLWLDGHTFWQGCHSQYRGNNCVSGCVYYGDVV